MGIVEDLQNSLLRLESVCAALSEQQLQFRPAPEAWSVAECVEHLATTERFILISIRRALQSETATTERSQSAAVKSEWLAQRIAGRQNKVTAPPPAQPAGRYGLWPGSLSEMRQGREKLLELAAQEDASWAAHLSPHPLIGDFNASQWLIFAESHTRRHIAQIEEILADPSFPTA
jgi:hypothetical protein